MFDWKTFEKVVVNTDHPVAIDSPDYAQPWGTARDLWINRFFNEKLRAVFKDKLDLKVLDLGCSGGAFIKTCIDDGCLGVGLEGSDYSARLNRAEWPYLKDKHLFTADITKPFTIESIHGGKKQPLKFDVITMWEVLEHLREDTLKQLFSSVKQHLEKDGLFIVSVCDISDIEFGVELHQTVKSYDWWEEKIKKEGFTRIPSLEKYFKGNYVRGPENNAAINSTNFIFSLSTNSDRIIYNMPRKPLTFRRTVAYPLRKTIRWLRAALTD